MTKIESLKKSGWTVLLFSLFLFPSLSVYAELSYDRYAAPAKQAESSSGKKVAAEILTYPLEIVRWPMDEGLRMTERHRLDTKGRYLYQRMQDYGITPHLNIMARSDGQVMA